MSISITRYIDITSGVGGATIVPERNLVCRLFTDNPLLPPQTFVQFTTLAQVAAYFGTTSQEYLRAQFYFSFVSKSLTTPQFIQFARWVDTAQAPMIFGIDLDFNYSTQFSTISNGNFTLTIGSVTETLAGLDFTSAGSLAGVATVLQTAIRAASSDAQWTGATVTFTVSGGYFELTGGTAAAAAISVVEGVTGTPVAALLGWFPGATFVNGVFTPGAIWAPGSAVETVTQCLTTSAGQSTNFGSYLFMTSTFTQQNAKDAATWGNAQNINYLYCLAVTASDAAAYFAAMGTIGGVAATLTPVLSPQQYPEMCPAMIEAATNYNNPNSAQNYMFQVFNGLTPSVTNDTDADTYDAMNINYYGNTQQAGAQINFYQRGVLWGNGTTNPVAQNVYVDEIWLKSYIVSLIMNLLITLNQVPANAQGRGQMLSTLQVAINAALLNGVISVGKTLTNSQIMFITQITNDPNAWQQVQTLGYWVDVVFVLVGSQYQAQYTLVYSKDDTINFVQGSDILI